MAQVSPASSAPRRVPLSQAQRKLAVPEIPGYHLYWFRGSPDRIAAAQAAGYEFVKPDEVSLNNFGIGNDALKTGNTDLGSRVSMVAGGELTSDNQAMRLYLMKQKMEYYLEDQKAVEARSEQTTAALLGAMQSGQMGGSPEDAGHRYVDKNRTAIPEMFRKKPQRSNA